MKVAYVILAHAFPDHFIRMVRKLDSDESLFFIHIDKKSEIEPFKNVERWVDSKKLVWLKRRAVVWAGFNNVRAALEGLSAAASHPQQVDFISLISGQHYPIKPVSEFHRFLRNHPGKSFIEFSPLPRPNWANGGLDRIHYYHFFAGKLRFAWPVVSYLKIKFPVIDPNRFRLLRKMVPYLPAAKKFPRKFLKGCEPFEGSNWFTLSGKLTREILDYLKKDNSFHHFFRFTLCSDEMFFQTLILNKFGHRMDEVINDNLLFIEWNENTGRPFSLTSEYLDKIKDSPAFLARKFEPELSKGLLQQIDSMTGKSFVQ